MVDKYNWPKHPLAGAESDEKSAGESKKDSDDATSNDMVKGPATNDDCGKKSIPESDVEDDDDCPPETLGEEPDAVTETGEQDMTDVHSVAEATQSVQEVQASSVAPLTVHEHELQKYYTQVQPSHVPEEIVDDANQLATTDTMGKDDVVALHPVVDKFIDEDMANDDEHCLRDGNDDDNAGDSGNTMSVSSATPPDNSPTEDALEQFNGKPSTTSAKSNVYFARKSLPVSPIAKSTQMGDGPMTQASEEQILSGQVTGPSVLVG